MDENEPARRAGDDDPVAVIAELLGSLDRGDWSFVDASQPIDLTDDRTERWPIVTADGTLVGTVVRLGVGPLDPVGAAIRTAAELAAMSARFQTEARRARAEADRDGLTGLYNRRGWERRLAEEQLRCDRRGVDAMVAVVDVDDLKPTNDTYVHRAGDALLCACAGALSSCVRGTDVVARVGGDEFAVLAGEWATNDPAAFVGRLKDALAAAGVRAAVGAVTHRQATLLDDTYQLADLAMCEIKQMSRNEAAGRSGVAAHRELRHQPTWADSRASGF